MSSQEKITFYKFLSLYLISSYVLLIIISFLYFETKKLLIHTDIHFKLHEQSTQISHKLNLLIKRGISDIDNLKKELPLEEYKIEFVNKDMKTLGKNATTYSKDILYKKMNDVHHNCLVAKEVSLKNSHNIWGYILKDVKYEQSIQEVKYNIYFAFLFISICVGIIGYFLSKLFLKPINNHIKNLNNFIKDINHELNTPITSLMIASKELSKKDDDRLIKSIRISAKQLYEICQTLININFSLKDNIENINLKDVLDESINYFSEILISKNIKIDKDIYDVFYSGDKEKLQRVFNNLISNAIKHSYPNSTIEISLKNNTFIIKDYGIGIAKDIQDKIFNRYYTQNKDSRSFGIGLDVIKKICFEYDIDISIQSVKNEYASFVLKFG